MRRSICPTPVPTCILCRAAAKRQITVAFAAEVQPGLKWSFTPCQKSIKIRPGQSTLVFYTAENLSDDHITAVSTYNVAPPQVLLLSSTSFFNMLSPSMQLFVYSYSTATRVFAASTCSGFVQAIRQILYPCLSVFAGGVLL